MTENEHPVFEYFVYNKETDSSKCVFEDCKRPNMTGKHVNNLRKHLERRHTEATNRFNQAMKNYSEKHSSKKKRKRNPLQ